MGPYIDPWGHRNPVPLVVGRKRIITVVWSEISLLSQRLPAFLHTVIRNHDLKEARFLPSVLPVNSLVNLLLDIVGKRLAFVF